MCPFHAWVHLVPVLSLILDKHQALGNEIGVGRRTTHATRSSDHVQNTGITFLNVHGDDSQSATTIKYNLFSRKGKIVPRMTRHNLA